MITFEALDGCDVAFWIKDMTYSQYIANVYSIGIFIFFFHSKPWVVYQQKGCLSEDEARFYTAEVVDALEYIHSMGLIHRDIKVSYLRLLYYCGRVAHKILINIFLAAWKLATYYWWTYQNSWFWECKAYGG